MHWLNQVLSYLVSDVFFKISYYFLNSRALSAIRSDKVIQVVGGSRIHVGHIQLGFFLKNLIKLIRDFSYKIRPIAILKNQTIAELLCFLVIQYRLHLISGLRVRPLEIFTAMDYVSGL